MGLESCTNEVQTSQPFFVDSNRVVLIDTPGFDDTTKSDTEVLKMIAAYLRTMFVPVIMNTQHADRFGQARAKENSVWRHLYAPNLRFQSRGYNKT